MLNIFKHIILNLSTWFVSFFFLHSGPAPCSVLRLCAASRAHAPPSSAAVCSFLLWWHGFSSSSKLFVESQQHRGDPQYPRRRYKL